MRKGKIGLQKEISKIFTGIQLPKKDDHANDAAHPAPPVQTPAPAPAHYIPPKPVASPARHFTIPEPAQNEPQTPVESAYKPQATKQTVCESPVASRVEPPVADKVEPPVVSRVEPPPARKVEPEPPVASRVEPPVAGKVEPPVAKKVEPPVVSRIEPPRVQKQNFYEPPPMPVFNAAQTSQKDAKPEPPPKRHLQIKLPKTWQKIKTRLLSTKPGVNPARQKATIVLVPVLLLVMVFLFARTLRTPTGTAPAPTGKTAASAAAAFDGKIDWELPPLYPENLRDPTTFGNVVAQTQENAGKTPVRGIVYSEDNPCAVVGDRIVSVGDVVNGATVVKINPGSVEFADGDKKWSQEVER